MAVAFDGEAVVQQEISGAGPHTFAGKTTAGSNRCGTFECSLSVIPFISGVTWNGVAMTLVDTEVDSGANKGSAMFRIVNPPTAASDVVLTTSAGVSGWGWVRSYNGVDQTTPIRSSNTANGGATSPATVAVNSAADDMAIDALFFEGAATPPSVGAGQTSRAAGDNGTFFGAGSEEPGAASVTMSWTLTSPSTWAIVAASLQAAGGAAETITVDKWLNTMPASHKRVWGVVPSGMVPPTRVGS